MFGALVIGRGLTGPVAAIALQREGSAASSSPKALPPTIDRACGAG